jgi:hypothetical protein
MVVRVEPGEKCDHSHHCRRIQGLIIIC